MQDYLPLAACAQVRTLFEYCSRNLQPAPSFCPGHPMRPAHATLGARSYGTFFGLACIVMAACATPDDPTGVPRNQPIFSEPTPFGSIASLTPSQRVRAISARSRAARGGKASRETIIRTYNKNGDVTSELKLVGTKWTERPSTLAPEFARQPLRYFLEDHRSPSLLSPGAILHDDASHSIYDSVTSVAATVAESITINEQDGTGHADRSSTDEYQVSAGTTYAYDTTQAHNTAYMTGGDVVFINPYTADEAVEVSIVGQQWTELVNQWRSDSADLMSLREKASPNPPQAVTELAMAGSGCAAQYTNAGVNLQYTHAFCIQSLHISGAFLLLSLLCMFARYYATGGAALLWEGAAIAAGVAGTGYGLAYVICRLDSPIREKGPQASWYKRRLLVTPLHTS